MVLIETGTVRVVEMHKGGDKKHPITVVTRSFVQYKNSPHHASDMDTSPARQLFERSKRFIEYRTESEFGNVIANNILSLVDVAMVEV